MKVLVLFNMFPSRGSTLGTFVERQIASLEANGMDVVRVVKRQLGLAGYLCFFRDSVSRLLFEEHDLAHAHYGFRFALLPALLGQ